MSGLTILLTRLGLLDNPGPRYFKLEAAQLAALDEIAAREQRPVREVVAAMVATGLDVRVTQERCVRCWQTLTRREKDVAALACRGLTNRQIANHLGISVETAKSHVAHVLLKFDVLGRGDLVSMLSGWDWSEWDAADRDYPDE